MDLSRYGIFTPFEHKLVAEIERLRAALEEIRDEHAEFDDLAYNIAIRALKDKNG